MFHEVHTQYAQQLNVRAGICGDHILGPSFSEGNLSGNCLTAQLHQCLVIEIIENDQIT